MPGTGQGRNDRGSGRGESAARGARASTRAGALRARRLRRLGRPDAPQDLSRAVRARDAQAPAGEVRDRRCRPLGLVGRRVPRPDGACRARVRPRRLRPGRLGLAGQGDAVHLPRLRGRVPREQPHGAPGRARRGARHAREPRLLPRDPAAGDADGCQGARRTRQGRRLEAPDRREAVWPRPRLGSRADVADRRALHRGRGLPDRPLPRQGNGPEHARAAVRERHLRADLEPAVRRPRPDHGRRDPRRRERARPTTTRPARSGTSSRTTRCNSSP